MRKRKTDRTSILAIHELQSLLLMAKPSSVVILTSGQVMAESLGIERRIDGRRGGGRRRLGGCASDGKARLSKPRGNPKRTTVIFRRWNLSKGEDATNVRSDRHCQSNSSSRYREKMSERWEGWELKIICGYVSAYYCLWMLISVWMMINDLAGLAKVTWSDNSNRINRNSIQIYIRNS